MKYILRCVVIVLVLSKVCAEDIFTTIESVAGQSVELPCNMTSENEGDKLNVLAWYKNDSTAAIYSRDLRSEQEGGGGGRSDSTRYRLLTAEGEARLEIIRVRPSDAGLYHCLADFAASPALKTHVLLAVIEAPQRMWVVHENGSRVATSSAGANASRDIGPYYVGDTLHLVCVVYGGKPKASLSWWSEGALLKQSSTPLSEQRARSDLALGPLRREHHGRVLTCVARNSNLVPPLAVDLVIDMLLPPELVSVRAASGTAIGRVRAGSSLLLECRVLGARPLPPITWRLGDDQLYNIEQNITVERAQQLVSSSIQLSVDREHDEARVTCCVSAHRRHIDFVCAEPLPIAVVYAPELNIVVEGEVNNKTLQVVKGSIVTLNCSYDANPSIYELIWYHEDDVVTKDTGSPGRLVEPSLVVPAAVEADAGEYVCAASNAEGSTTSDPLYILITYPPHCVDPTPQSYGVGAEESINMTCNMAASPLPSSYRWVLFNDSADSSGERPSATLETDRPVLSYQRPVGLAVTTILCWGINDVVDEAGSLPNTPCTFVVTDETAPQPPAACSAVRGPLRDITVTCQKGHDGGLRQRFIFIVKSLVSENQLLSITNLEPQFIISEPTEENYKFVIYSSNEKGDSSTVEIAKEDIVDQTGESGGASVSAMADITTLALALCGGVALVALAACGLVLCARDAGSARACRTNESNCEMCNDSDDGSDYNVRRTESFRRAVSRYPSRNFDVRRTSSFHSARCINETSDDTFKPKHTSTCRVHSMQNISRKRDMDALCDHLVMQLPPEANYNVPRTVNTFYTIPRKNRQKILKELSDETSEITQNSDGFSLPPPPDEFGTYRSGMRINNKDMPSKSTSSYATIRKDQRQYNNVMISPMNTVGLPTISGGQNDVYSYPDDNHQDEGEEPTLTTFRGIASKPREGGF